MGQVARAQAGPPPADPGKGWLSAPHLPILAVGSRVRSGRRLLARMVPFPLVQDYSVASFALRGRRGWKVLSLSRAEHFSE